ncbi:hypothetical protein D6833_00700 [Candidatus Parcubacteria bacterium]|nr:MAG: hypothetical protein D6833_00700 [Candidatus Parcubacteria bacterium]
MTLDRENQNDFLKNLRDRFLRTQATHDTREQADIVSEMLGFVGRLGAESVVSDIRSMLRKGYTKELDGYVLAISRIMKHELALACIRRAFNDVGLRVPDRYVKQFKATEQQAPPRMVAQ